MSQEQFLALPVRTLTFTKAISFPGKRFKQGEQLNVRIVQAFVDANLVERFTCVPDGTELALVGISYRSVELS